MTSICLIAAAAAVCAEASADQTSPWMDFPVEPQKIYTVECRLAGGSSSGEATLRFLDAEGRDVALVERSLGFDESVVRVSFTSGAERVSLTCRAGSHAGINPVRGIVTCKSAGQVRVRSCRHYEGAPPSAETRTAGFEHSLAGNGAFSDNLVPNGSFEDLDSRGLPRGWSWAGPGTGRIVSNAYAGSCAIRLTPKDEGGRWESAPAPLAGTNTVWVMYAVKFSRHATPLGHLDPVRMAFWSRGADGRLAKIAEPSQIPRQEYSYAAYERFKGEWFPVLAKSYAVPDGAVAVSVFCEHRDARMDGRGGSANWGDIYVDNVAVWQMTGKKTPAALKSFVYAPLYFHDGVRLPPQLPVGKFRENSVSLAQARHRDGSVFFADENEPLRVEMHVGDLLGYSRTLSLRCRVEDCEGRVLSSFTNSVSLSPFELKNVSFSPDPPKLFGAYEISCDVFEGEAKVGKGSARFAVAARRPRIPHEERCRDDYPFDLHLGARFTFTWDIPGESAELQAHLCEMMGVRGVRVQTGYDSFDVRQTPGEAAAAAGEIVRKFRQTKLSALERHGLKWWPSLMEQGAKNLPRTPRGERELAAWRAWHEAFAKALCGDADFVLYGNEGLGGYTAHMGPDADLMAKSGFNGSTRQWWICCREALAALRAGDPGLLCGPSHASDEKGDVAKRFRELPEGNFPFDCWGVNSYGASADIVKAVAGALGADATSRSFGVIPEVGYGARSRRDFAEAARRVPEAYLTVLADVPWVRRIAWFILTEMESYGMFDDSYAARPAAVAYMTMTDALGAGRVVAHRRLPDDGRFFVWRRSDGRHVGVGWSPSGLSVPIGTDAGDVELRDLYGNTRKIPCKGGEAIVALEPRATYVLGGNSLSLVETMRVSADCRGGRSPYIELTVTNLRGQPVAATLAVEAHPFVKLHGAPSAIELAAGEKRRMAIPFSAFRPEDGRRLAVRFLVRDSHGISHEAQTDVAGCAAKPLPANLLANGGFGDWGSDGLPAGWDFSLVKGPGGKAPPEWKRGRCDGDGGRSAPCAAIIVPGKSQTMARMEYFRNVPLKACRRYVFSVSMRVVAAGAWSFPLVVVQGDATEPRGRQVMLKKIRLGDGADKAAQGWERFECTFATGDKGPFSASLILRMQNLGYGEVRFDDAELLDLGPVD